MYDVESSFDDEREDTFALEVCVRVCVSCLYAKFVLLKMLKRRGVCVCKSLDMHGNVGCVCLLRLSLFVCTFCLVYVRLMFTKTS